MNLSWY